MVNSIVKTVLLEWSCCYLPKGYGPRKTRCSSLKNLHKSKVIPGTVREKAKEHSPELPDLIACIKYFFPLQFIALVMICVAVYAKASSKITSLPILGGVVACGVFLLLIAIMGVAGAVRHSQVILFFVSFSWLWTAVKSSCRK